MKKEMGGINLQMSKLIDDRVANVILKVVTV